MSRSAQLGLNVVSLIHPMLFSCFLVLFPLSQWGRQGEGEGCLAHPTRLPKLPTLARPNWFAGLGHWAPSFRALFFFFSFLYSLFSFFLFCSFSFFLIFFFLLWLLLFVPASIFWFLNGFWTSSLS